MKIKISKKFLSISPYLSTRWSQVVTLQVKEEGLLICLLDGKNILIPKLKPETLELLFHYHALSMEDSTSPPTTEKLEIPTPKPVFQTPSIQFALGNMDNISSVMQHNPEQANAPDLPPEVLEKITAIAKIVAFPDEALLPVAQEGCNCFHCQIARAINPQKNSSKENTVEPEEEVSDEDLLFNQWDITQTGENLFCVTNRLDHEEKYSVYLGHPIGCTCGKEGCEHILAVLKS